MLDSTLQPTPSQLKWLREAAHAAHEDTQQCVIMRPCGLLTQGELDRLRLRELAILTLLNTFEKPSAELLAENHGAALAYILFRKVDNEQLSKELHRQQYAKLVKTGTSYEVNGRKCASLECACAYILSKWW
jgi:hypothetical protein